MDTVHVGIGREACGGPWSPKPSLKGEWLTFRTLPEASEGAKAIYLCENTRSTRIVLSDGPSCPQGRGGSTWLPVETIFVPEGSDFCAGHHQVNQEAAQLGMYAYSRVLDAPNCSGDGFVHDFQFGALAPPKRVPALDSGRSSPQELAESSINPQAPPLYQLVQEDEHCDGFLCPHLLDLSSFKSQFALD